MLIMLMDALIEQEHEVFRGKGTASFLRAKIRRAIEREYPETEADIPEDQRRGHIPPSIEEELNRAEEDQDISPGAPRACVRMMKEKNAAPGDAAHPADKIS